MKVKEFTTAITEQFTSLGKESSRIHTYGTNVYGLFDYNGYRYHFNAFLRNGKAGIEVGKVAKNGVHYNVLYLMGESAITVLSYVKVVVESSIANAKIDALIAEEA